MRKYRPANGSHSQFYAEQLSIDSGRSKRPERSTPGDLNSPKFEAGRKGITRRNNPSSLSTEKMSSRAAYESETPYMQQLRKIR